VALIERLAHSITVTFRAQLRLNPNPQR